MSEQQQHEWYYASGGVQMGPVDGATLKRLAASGELKPAELVWRDGMGDWVSASKVPGLFATATPAPLAVAPTGAAPAPEYALQQPPQARADVLPYGTGAGVMPAAHPTGGVTARGVDLLNQTRPWVMFFAVLMFIASALGVLGGIAMLLMGVVGAASGPRGAGAGLGAIGLVLGLIYIAMAAMYFFPGLHLMRFGSRIAQLRASGRVEDLENALESQKSFWKFIGIAAIVGICLYFLLIMVMVVAGAMR
jgi:hypothetical protein